MKTKKQQIDEFTQILVNTLLPEDFSAVVFSIAMETFISAVIQQLVMGDKTMTPLECYKLALDLTIELFENIIKRISDKYANGDFD